MTQQDHKGLSKISLEKTLTYIKFDQDLKTHAW